MRSGVTEGLIWLVVTGLLLIDSRRNPVPWELVGGLVVVTLAVAAIRRFPVISLALAMSSGVALVFDYGGRVPVWPMLLMASVAYCVYFRHRTRQTETRGRLRERARIAADMHDSLGHELTLIAVRASVLQVSSGLDEQQRKAVGELRESAAAATERLREIIGVLRGPPETIAGLIARSEASGMVIKAKVEDVSPEVEPVAYRVVQEALTNAAKHAPGATVVVEVTRTGVSVINEPPAAPSPGLASGGHGLSGLRDRVKLAGGYFQAGPRDGGFAVTATFRETT
ncbi:signal transduction histidine kinase [Kibdelosporangium banguiense]|uniref:histidine kinase n=1 Tax=Kibdelosporangium banguiense TaxID=1365924 RepID=A0ABS4TKF4_9PSEU|nr:histidine kinase [Kibdelosporangium banguiense]MBP2324500.1 signal transduction histidine kinase [Kibdelosporangium banguiense]